MYKLAVWKTLKKNGRLHFMLGNSQYLSTLEIENKSMEIYWVSSVKLFVLDVIEFVCGYKRYKDKDVFIYKPFIFKCRY